MISPNCPRVGITLPSRPAMPMDGAPQRTPGCRQRSLRQAICIHSGRRSARAGPPHTSGASGPRPASARSGRDPATAAWASAGGIERSITGRQFNANRRLVSVVTTESSTIDVTVRSAPSKAPSIWPAQEPAVSVEDQCSRPLMPSRVWHGHRLPLPGWERCRREGAGDV